MRTSLLQRVRDSLKRTATPKETSCSAPGSRFFRLMIERLEDRINPNAFSVIGNDMQSILQPVESAMGVVSSIQNIDIPFVGSQIDSALTSGTSAVQGLLTPLENAANELANGNPTNQQIQDAFLSVLGPDSKSPFLQPIYYNQVGRVSESNPASGSGTVTLKNGSTDVVFSTPQSFSTTASEQDFIQLDSDGPGLSPPGPWTQIADGGTGTTFQLTTPYTGTGGTGTWSRNALAPPVDNTTNTATITTSSSGVSTVSFANAVTFTTGDNFELDDDGTWYQISAGGTGTSFALTTTYTGSVTSGAWSTVPASPVYVWTTTDGDNISIEMRLVDTFTTDASISFSTGLPSLPIGITANGGVQLSAGFAFELGITSDGTTASLNNNVLLSDAFPSGSGNPATGVTPYGNGAGLPDSAHQLAAFVSATLPQGFSATAFVGFLRGTITDNGQPSNPDPTTHTQLAAELAVDNLTSSPTVQLIGNADVNLGLNLSFGTGTTAGGVNLDFPSVNADLQLVWNLNSNDPNDASSTPTVNFTNVSLDLGTFLSSCLGPVLSVVQDALSPLQPVLKVLDTPIPGLSDISNLLGDGNVTLMTIAGLAASEGGYGPLFNLVQTVAEIATDIGELQIGNDIQWKLGSFNLNNDNLIGQGSTPAVFPSDPNFLNVGQYDDTSSLLPDVSSEPTGTLDQELNSLDVPGGISTDLRKALENAQAVLNSGFQLEFPVLTNPQSVIFGMLLGQDSDLVTLTAQLNATAGASALPSLNYFGEGLSFNGSVNVSANIKLGYDTYGIRQLVQAFSSGSTPSAGTIADDILNGFYIADSSTIQISGSLGVYAGASFGIASASIGGGITTGDGGTKPISVTMSDPNSGNDGGKFRVPSLFQDPSNPFTVGGELDASLDIVLQIGVNLPVVGFVGYSQTFNVAKVVLVDLNPPPPSPTPVLASQPDSNGQVTLYIGAEAEFRQDVDDTDGGPNGQGEDYTIDHVSGPAGDETIKISAFGVSQTISGVASIVGDGDAGNLTITVDPGVEASVDLHGGQGTADLTYSGSGTASLYAGQLGGTLQGGTGPNYLYGTSGGTTPPISSSNVADTLIGGDGHVNNYFYPGAASTLLEGGNQDTNNFMYAGLLSGNTNVDPQGTTFMIAGGGVNIYQWTEGDGPIIITGINPDNIDDANQLKVVGGAQGNETWQVSQQGNGVTIQGSASNGALILGTPIIASGLSELTLNTSQGSLNSQGNYVQTPNPGGNKFRSLDLAR